MVLIQCVHDLKKTSDRALNKLMICRGRTTILPNPVNISTPIAFIELVKLLRILEARLFA